MIFRSLSVPFSDLLIILVTILENTVDIALSRISVTSRES